MINREGVRWHREPPLRAVLRLSARAAAPAPDAAANATDTSWPERPTPAGPRPAVPAVQVGRDTSCRRGRRPALG